MSSRERPGNSLNATVIGVAEPCVFVQVAMPTATKHVAMPRCSSASRAFFRIARARFNRSGRTSGENNRLRLAARAAPGYAVAPVAAGRRTGLGSLLRSSTAQIRIAATPMSRANTTSAT